MLGEWDSDAGLEVLAAPASGGENASLHFRRLEELYESEKAELERDGYDTAGVRALLAAAECGSCRLIPEYYPEFDRVSAKQPDFIVLRIYLRALLTRADRLEKAGDMGEAERCYRAVLLCGRHLTSDKSSVLVYLSGLIFKLRGAQAYERFLRRAGNAELADDARAFAGRTEGLLRFFNWKANVALNLQEGFDGVPAMILIAEEDAEVCWRKEALIRLAILRHGAARLAENSLLRDPVWEEAAGNALAKAAESDPEPSVRRLAAWAVANVRPETAGRY